MTAKSKTFQSPYSEEFELFWRLYPPRWNENRQAWTRADKQGAWLEWQKLTYNEMIKAIEAAAKEKASKWTPDARKWLKHKRWEDVISIKKYPEPATSDEVQAIIAKLACSLKTIPRTRLSDYELNKRRNENLDKLEASR